MLFQAEKVVIVKKGSQIGKRKTGRKKKCPGGSENERNSSLNLCPCLFSPMRSRTSSEKVSFCTFFRKKLKKASIGLETAMVLPFFLLGTVNMICFMDVYRIQTEHLSALCQKAKEAGMYAYVLDGSGVEEITLPDVYSYKPIGGLIPLPEVWMHNTVKVHAWTGTDHEALAGGGEDAETEHMVFVTESGSVYHKDLGCSYLDLSIHQVSGSNVESMRNENGERYQACEICSRNQKAEGTVFITESGNRYHNLETCSGLKRSVRLVKESQTGDLCACSRCG